MLREYTATPHPYNPPKQVARQDEQLRREIEACKRRLRHWNNLPAIYAYKAQNAATPSLL